MVSIVNALCIVSCLCLLDGHQGGIRSSYLWTWGFTSGYSNYVYVCVIVCMYDLLCHCVPGYVLVWPVIRGVTLSDYGLTTGFGSFNLLTCGPLPKGRDHSHACGVWQACVCVVYCCDCLFVAVACCLFYVYLFSRIRLWLQIFSVHIHVCGKLWGVCILCFLVMTVILCRVSKLSRIQ